MSLAASAKPLARERSSSENFLKALQQAESGTKETAPISGDYSFVEPKTTSKSLQMRILDPVHHPGWDAVDKDFAVLSIEQDGYECRTLVCGSPQIDVFR